MLSIFIRTFVMYFFVVVALRLLGKRQIGELEPSELVVAIIISEVASMPIQDTSVPITHSLIIIGSLLIFEFLLSFGAYKSIFARRIFYGRPSIFYEKGHINQKEMAKQRFNLNDLLECVRNSGIPGLDEVDYVIMETNGNVSVIQKSEKRPVAVEDMGISPEASFISYIIIDNGYVNKKNLKLLGYDENWLKKELAKHNIKTPSEVFCFTADIKGNTILIPKDKSSKK